MHRPLQAISFSCALGRYPCLRQCQKWAFQVVFRETSHDFSVRGARPSPFFPQCRLELHLWQQAVACTETAKESAVLTVEADEKLFFPNFVVWLLLHRDDGFVFCVLNDWKLSFFNSTFKFSLMSRTDSSVSRSLVVETLALRSTTTMDEALQQLAERLAGVENALMLEKTARLNAESDLQSLRAQMTPTGVPPTVDHTALAASVAWAVVAAQKASRTEPLHSRAFSKLDKFRSERSRSHDWAAVLQSYISNANADM